MPLKLADATRSLSEMDLTTPIGFACYNDDVAMAVLAAARTLGLDTPHQVSAVGVDNSSAGQLWSPRLTSIEVDIRAIMDATVMQLRDLLGLREAGAATSGPLVSLILGESS